MSVVLPIITQFDNKGIQQAKKEFKQLEGFSAKAGYAAQKAVVPATAAIALLTRELGKAVKAAVEDKAAQDQLALAIRNNTNATEAQITGVEKTISRMEMQKAVADDQLRPALGNLVRATGDVTKAQGLLELALDISAATGRDLQSVTLALSKAQTGQVTALTRLGIPLDAAAVKSKDLEAIQADLAQRFRGASDAAAKSAQGGMKKLEIALDNLYEQVGYKLLPVLGDYVTVLADIAGKALDADKSTGGWGKTVAFLFGNLIPGIKTLQTLNKFVGNYADKTEKATQVTSRVTNSAKERAAFEGNLTTAIDDQTKSTVKNTAAKDKAAAAAKKLRDSIKAAQDALDEAKKAIRDDFAKALDIAKDKLQMAQDAFDGFAKSVSESLTSALNFRDAYEAGQDTGAGFIAGLTEQATKIKTFGELVNRLIAGGLSEKALGKVLDAGVDAGTAIAKELLEGSGNILKANELVKDVQNLADRVGVAAAGRYYSAGVEAGKNLVAGVQSVIDSYEIRLNIPGLTAADVRGLQGQFAGGAPSGIVGMPDPVTQTAAFNDWVTAGLMDLQNIGPGLIPMFGDGGIVSRPTLGIIGEAGPEAVVPLDRLGAMGNTTVNINVNGGDPNAVVDALKRYYRQNGPLPVAVSY